MDKILDFVNTFHYSFKFDSCQKLLDDWKGAKIYNGEKIGWSKENPQAAMFLKSIVAENNQTTVKYVYKGDEAQYHLPFIDEASVSCSIAVAAVARYLGLDAKVLDERMAKLEPVAMRLEVKEGQHGCTLINDSYNSDVNSLDIALDFMNRRPDHQGRKRTLILSDIQQSGKSDFE